LEKATVYGTHTSTDPTCQSLACLSSPISRMALQRTGRREAAPPLSSTTRLGPRHQREGGVHAWAPARGGREKAELASMEKGRSRRLLDLIFPRSGKERPSLHPWRREVHAACSTSSSPNTARRGHAICLGLAAPLIGERTTQPVGERTAPSAWGSPA
jgi:hypothetical protein